MDVVFLDANVLFSAAYRAGSAFGEFWRLPDTRLITSAYAAEEARRNLRKPEHLSRLDSLLSGVVMVPESSGASTHSGLPRIAKKDQPILEAAITARATHLVTGDKQHFAELYGRTVAGTAVLTPAEYLNSRSAL